ncbi:MAG: CbiQ family ECF transporter T component [Firmicutes bacterium]|nr:CbiQ family ECF transporter T component [Bacillota bacterium]
MDISFIDNLAYNTESIMHRASAPAKILMVGLIITTVVISGSPVSLAVALITLVVVVLISRLPVAKILSLASYAFFFSLIFALSQVGGGITAPVVIVLKATVAALSLLLLITTTPYPQIFAILQKVLPSVLVDAMLVTYRSFFVLIGQISSRITVIRIRAGYSPLNIVKNLSDTGSIIGHGFIHAWELSESMQDAMFVRGYTGKFPLSLPLSSISWHDAFPLAIGLLILLVAVV